MHEIMPYYKIKIGLRATKVGVGLGLHERVRDIQMIPLK